MGKKKKPRLSPVPAEHIPGLTDAHTHLASCGARTLADIEPFIERFVAAGVDRVCTVGDGLDECEDALFAARHCERIYAATAIHPTRAKELNDEARERLTEMAHDPRVVAIGETGLDTYWLSRSDTCAPLSLQLEALEWHIELARSSGKALMIHNREADEQLLDALAGVTGLRAIILHCFSSPLAVAEEALHRGYVLSFSGNVTFKNNTELREAARIAPAGQLLIETDAPYMTPEPYRGSRNEPALIGHTALCVAAARGVEVDELAASISDTFDHVYGLGVAG